MKIRTYKKFVITYDKKTKIFNAKLGTRNFSASEENQVINLIDRQEKELQEENKKKEQEKATKIIDDAQFKIKAPDFMYFCKCISQYVNEISVAYENQQFISIAFDPANVCMIQMHMPAECNKEIKYFKFAVNVKHLEQILNSVVSKGDLKLIFKLSEKRLDIQNEFGLFNLPLLDELHETKMPALGFSHKFVMAEKLFQYYMRCSDKVASSVMFRVKDRKLNFVATGDLLDYYISPSIELDAKDITAKYSIQFLRNLKFKGKLKFEFKEDYPLSVTDPKGNAFILAPRVDYG